MTNKRFPLLTSTANPAYVADCEVTLRGSDVSAAALAFGQAARASEKTGHFGTACHLWSLSAYAWAACGAEDLAETNLANAEECKELSEVKKDESAA